MYSHLQKQTEKPVTANPTTTEGKGSRKKIPNPLPLKCPC